MSELRGKSHPERVARCCPGCGSWDECQCEIMPEPECCAGCGDADPEFVMHGDPYCYSCASCDVCQSPYCEDPSHE